MMIRLRHYAHEKKGFLLDDESGSVTVLPQINDKNEAGYGMFRRIGFFGHRKLFVALYCYQGTIIMRIGDQSFKCTNETFRVERKAIAPFVKRFSVLSGDQILLTLHYLYTDLLGNFPDDPHGDFFAYIEEQIRTPPSVKWFIYVWTAVSQGRDILSQEFINDFRRSESRELRADVDAVLPKRK